MQPVLSPPLGAGTGGDAMARLADMILSRCVQRHERRPIDSAESRTVAVSGLERWQLARDLSFPAEIPERMERMARVHGLELARVGVDRATMLEMTERCGACAAYLDCAEALSEARASPESCRFCPNAGLYRDVALRQGTRG